MLNKIQIIITVIIEVFLKSPPVLKNASVISEPRSLSLGFIYLLVALSEPLVNHLPTVLTSSPRPRIVPQPITVVRTNPNSANNIIFLIFWPSSLFYLLILNLATLDLKIFSAQKLSADSTSPKHRLSQA